MPHTVGSQDKFNFFSAPMLAIYAAVALVALGAYLGIEKEIDPRYSSFLKEADDAAALAEREQEAFRNSY
jgi:hypothetical protein